MTSVQRSFVCVCIVLCVSGPAAGFESDFLSVETRGDGPDVVLIHGFACSSEVWAGVADDLVSRYRLHLVQVAGFAGSPAPQELPQDLLKTLRDELLRYIEEEGLDRPAMAGHSMGGLLSLLTVSRAPERVGRVVVVDSAPFFSLLYNADATSENVRPWATAMGEQLLTLNAERFEAQVNASVAILTKSPERRATLVEWSKACDRRVYAQLLSELMIYDARPELESIECPVTVLMAYDPAMGVSEREYRERWEGYYADLEGVKIVAITDSYHFVMWDQPDAFAEALKEGLTESGG